MDGEGILLTNIICATLMISSSFPVKCSRGEKLTRFKHVFKLRATPVAMRLKLSASSSWFPVVVSPTTRTAMMPFAFGPKTCSAAKVHQLLHVLTWTWGTRIYYCVHLTSWGLTAFEICHTTAIGGHESNETRENDEHKQKHVNGEQSNTREHDRKGTGVNR